MERAAILLFSAAALTLVACSREPDTDQRSDLIASPSIDPPPTSGPDANGPDASELVTTPDDIGTIPVAIRGRWGLVPADCTSTRGDTKGLLTIDAGYLKFYESVGKLGNTFEEWTKQRIRSAFTFSGEGMTWQREILLDVQDGGKTLVRREYGEDAAPGPFKYTRCPA